MLTVPVAVEQDPLKALKIVGDTEYATYREVAEALCIVPEAKEAELAMAEAVANAATPESLISLFTILTIHDFITVTLLTQSQHKYICDATSAHHSHLPDAERRDLLLTDLQTSLAANGKSL